MSIEKKKKELELLRVQAAKFEMELKIEERKEEISRLEANIKIQQEAEIRIQKELNELK